MNVVFDLESVGNTELLGPPHDKYLRCVGGGRGGRND